MKTRNFALASSALAAMLLLGGCSSGMSGMDGMDDGPSSPSATTATFNDADVDFAMNMVAHHQQAIEMADLVLDKEGVNDEVINLALAIKEAQGPEIDTMTAWLDSWGQGSMSGMDHGGGMMSEDDMAALESATGPEASSLFLEQMIEHHQGAITMAQDEVDMGENPDATALAQKIIDDQTSEIATMQDLLANL
jgi:uncharacterized protein (DUF305 family)